MLLRKHIRVINLKTFGKLRNASPAVVFMELAKYLMLDVPEKGLS